MVTKVAEQTSFVSQDLQAQREYARRMHDEGVDFNLVIADAFIRGIRDLGYKNTGTALDELIDNAIQAEAENIYTVFGYGATGDNKPDSIAVIDDGHGMDPEMIRLSVMWGGTHRENDRRGFGRYGYGEPSACVSQGRRYTVYSIVEGSTWYKVTVDLAELTARENIRDGRITVPEAEPATLPLWLRKYISGKRDGQTLRHGTIIVIEKLDKLTWKTTTALERNLLEHFGLTYRNFVREVNLVVNDKQVGAIDPLFITEGARFYDLDEDRAEALPAFSIDVKDKESGAQQGKIKIRLSYMPPTFLRVPEAKLKERGKNNARFHVRKQNNGIIVLREGRQIDVLSRVQSSDGDIKFTFMNNDRYIGIEVDFPATLDEEFSVTTSKQQIVINDRVWDLLKQHGLFRAITAQRRRLLEDLAKLKASIESPEDTTQQRASELAVTAAADQKSRRPGGDPAERQKKNQEQFEQEARRRARESGKSVEEAERELAAELEGRKYVVREESLPGAPFYRVLQLGSTVVLYINTAHSFYTKVFRADDTSRRTRSKLECLLFALADSELDASDAGRTWYRQERVAWSMSLERILDQLEQFLNEEDEKAGAQEEIEASESLAFADA